MGTRIISFLGLGQRDPKTGDFDYRPTTYVLNDGQRCETKFVTLALAKFYMSTDVRLLVTAESKKRWKEEVPAAFAAEELKAPTFIDVPDGRNEPELWELFEACRTCIVAPGADDIVLDMTHAFRSMPLIMGAASIYVRLVEEPAPNIRISYGAFEQKTSDNQTPVVDLTAFIDIVTWAEAILLFTRTGRVDRLAAMIEAESRESAKTWSDGGKTGAKPAISKLGKPLAEFGKDLATVRLGWLLTTREKEPPSAKTLVQAVDAFKNSGEALPALKPVLDGLRDMAAPLSGEPFGSLTDARAKPALAGLARIYQRLGRHLESAAVAHEGLVLAHASDPAAGICDQAHDKAAYKKAELARPKQIYTTSGNVRDDLLHGGIRKKPNPPDALVKGVENMITLLEQSAWGVVAPHQGQAGEAASPLFLNLSNHPSKEWDERQRQAARLLAKDGEIADLPFPSVEPEASSCDLETTAQEILEAIPQHVTHAMVQGEPVLAAILVKGLQQRGVTCLAATTKRDVAMDNGEKRSRFAFVQFRGYPHLA